MAGRKIDTELTKLAEFHGFARKAAQNYRFKCIQCGIDYWAPRVARRAWTALIAEATGIPAPMARRKRVSYITDLKEHEILHLKNGVWVKADHLELHDYIER